MFLTRASLNKIRLTTALYVGIGVFCLSAYVIFLCLAMKTTPLLVLAIVCFALAPIVYNFGKYAEGKGKLINTANKLLLHELRPAEMIRIYEEKRSCPENVIVRDDSDVLRLLTVAYDLLDDKDNTLRSIDRALLAATKNKIGYVKALKAGILFNMNRCDEAEALYKEVLNSSPSMMAKYALDTVMRSDRAIALGDYTTAEAYFTDKLARPALNKVPLQRLYNHLGMATLYLKTERHAEAISHLEYCISNGGETSVPDWAQEQLREIRASAESDR